MFDSPATGGHARNGAVDRATWRQLTVDYREQWRTKQYSDDLWEIFGAERTDARAQFIASIVKGVFTDAQYSQFIDAANRERRNLIVDKPWQRLKLAADFEAATSIYLDLLRWHYGAPSFNFVKRKELDQITTWTRRLLTRLEKLSPAAKSVIEQAAGQLRRDHETKGIVSAEQIVSGEKYYSDPTAILPIRILFESVELAPEIMREPPTMPEARITFIHGVAARTGLPRKAPYDEYEPDPDKKIKGALVDLGVPMLAAISELVLPGLSQTCTSRLVVDARS